jgi:hypothetical protein
MFIFVTRILSFGYNDADVKTTGRYFQSGRNQILPIARRVLTTLAGFLFFNAVFFPVDAPGLLCHHPKNSFCG